MNNVEMSGGVCKCPHHKMVPGLIMLIGLTFLLGHFGTLTQDTVNLVWPILLIAIGAMKMMVGACKCCSSMH